MKKLLFLIILVVFGGSVWLIHYTYNSADHEQSEEEWVNQSVSKMIPAFSHEGNSIIEVKDFIKFENKWYVVNIGSLHETTNDIPVYLILLKNNNELRVILGPATHFTETEMLQYNIPDSIMKEFL